MRPSVPPVSTRCGSSRLHTILVMCVPLGAGSAIMVGAASGSTRSNSRMMPWVNGGRGWGLVGKI